MRKLSHLILFLLLGSSSAHAQDANKVIDQYLRSAGGSNKLSKLLTLSLEGSLTRASDGKTGAFTLDSKSPNRYYLELTTEVKYLFIKGQLTSTANKHSRLFEKYSNRPKP